MSKKAYFGFGGGMGPFIRCAELAVTLKESGWTCGFYSFDESSVPMAKLGFEKIPINGSPANNPEVLGNKNNWKYGAELWGLYGYHDVEYLRELWSMYEKKILSFDPDLIISDLNIPSIMAAKKNDIPLLTYTQSCYYPGQPSVRYWEDDRMHLDSKKMETKVLNNINHLIKSYHKKEIETFNHIFIGDITVIPSFEEFDPVYYDVQPLYAGPLLWEKAIDDSELIKSDRKKVFIYLGRISDSSDIDTADILRNLFGFARKNREYDFIFASGGFFKLSDVGVKDEDNVIIRDKWVPLAYLRENVSLIIHHGGHGSCMGSFKYGIPAIIIPTHSEREYNARMMERLECGRMLLTDESDFSDKLTGYLSELLHNDKYINNTRRFKETIEKRNYAGVSRIVEAINKLV